MLSNGQNVDVVYLGKKWVVIVDGAVSEESDVLIGVPQSYVLGPLLFIILVTDRYISGITAQRIYVFC